MALRNPKLFGLNVFSALADVVDKEQSLNSLNFIFYLFNYTSIYEL